MPVTVVDMQGEHSACGKPTKRYHPKGNHDITVRKLHFLNYSRI